MENKCGSTSFISEKVLVRNIQDCAINCHQTSDCYAFDAEEINDDTWNYECALKDNRDIIDTSNCNNYDFNKTSYYILDPYKLPVRLLKDISHETDVAEFEYNGRVQIFYNDQQFSNSNISFINTTTGISTTDLLKWGVILSEGFDDNAADVLCGSLAYNQIAIDIITINAQNINDTNIKMYAETLSNSGDEYIWIKEIECNGNEKSLWDCNVTLPTDLIKFDINEHETVAVICQQKVPNCEPFSIFITEQNQNQIQPKVIAPYFDPINNGFEYIGCFEIGEEMHIKKWFELDQSMTPNKCYFECLEYQMSKETDVVFDTFVIKNGGYCGCGNEYGKYGLIDESNCNVQCLGNIDLKMCGGINAYTAFQIEYYQKMMLQHDESIVFSINQNTTITNGDNDNKANNRDIDNEYEYYYSKFIEQQLSANDDKLTLPLQRGFTVDPSATYKIWYGENLRRINIENNIGESCVSLTIDAHQHPLSWLENEKQELIDDGAEDKLDYNQLFL